MLEPGTGFHHKLMRLDAEYWRGRAEEARAVADQFRDPSSWRTMMAIAEGYEQMSKVAERLAESAAILRNITTLWPLDQAATASSPAPEKLAHGVSFALPLRASMRAITSTPPAVRPPRTRRQENGRI